jgi:hypothetical protein
MRDNMPKLDTFFCMYNGCSLYVHQGSAYFGTFSVGILRMASISKRFTVVFDYCMDVSCKEQVSQFIQLRK